MTSTIRLVRTIIFIGLSETNTIGYYILRTKPTVCLYVTSLVASSYGYDDGKNGPARCALIGAARGDR